MKARRERFDVAVFPLFNAVLFPGTTLPLQILEARYSEMLKDVQDQKKPLAVALVLPGEGEELILNSICGVGEVQVCEDHGDGRSEILVHGSRRVRLCSVKQQTPYLVMEAEELEPEDGVDFAFDRTFEDFVSLVKTWAFLNPKFPDQLTAMFDEFANYGELTDFFVFHFMKDAEMKQLYLDCNNPLLRAAMLCEYLEADLERQTRRASRQKRRLLLH